MDNIRVTKNKKYMTLEFTYTSPGNGALKFTAPGDAHMGSPNSSFALMKETTTTVGANKVYHLEYLIIPQPNWEWIRVHNTGTGPTGTVTITKTTWNAKCWPIPSLTPYGLMLLVLLLAGTAAWVIRRRSAVVSV
jgi:hypothetical protein